jgi:hypothetical protein
MHSAQFVKLKALKVDGQVEIEEIPVDCPVPLVEMYLGRVGLWKPQPVAGIINTPIPCAVTGRCSTSLGMTTAPR